MTNKEKRLKQWLDDNSNLKLSYHWYNKNVPPDLEDTLNESKNKFFTYDYLNKYKMDVPIQYY